MNEFFDQNPISQMAILISREGAAERLSPLSGTSSSIVVRLLEPSLN